MAPLLFQVEARLLELLSSLSPDEWSLPTIVPGWTVHHIAAHLLDGALRKVAIVRDHHVTQTPDGDLVAFINQLNATGVAQFLRLSPRQILQHLTIASAEFCAFHATLDPAAPAAFPVSWAGEDHSNNAFDTARELTERWHHQQQIRLAVNKPGILIPELYHPVLDTFLRALPHTYRNIPAAPGTTLHIHIAGPSGGHWYLHRAPHSWVLTRDTRHAAASIVIPEDIAWRIFTKGISPPDAAAQTAISGDRALAIPVLGAIAIVG